MTRKPSAFTLVEMLVSTTILTLLLTILLQMVNQTSRTWRNGAAKAEQFSEARKAFETMTQRLSNATLNAYWDYAYDPSTATVKVGGATVSQSALVTDYVRQSDLRFRVVQMSQDNLSATSTLDPQLEVYLRPTHGVFFQAPFGSVDDGSNLGVLSDLLNSWGYYIEVGNTNDRLPKFLKTAYGARYRSRLMEFGESAENFTLYKLGAKIITENKASNPLAYPSRDPALGTDGHVRPSDDAWFTDAINGHGPGGALNRPVRVLAENIIALVILPRLSPDDEQQRLNNGISSDLLALSPEFRYHSKDTSNYKKVPNARLMAQQATVYGGINPKNQIPPLVQVAMIAIDETSAATLARTAAEPATLDLKNILQIDQGRPLFSEAANLESSPAMQNGGDLQVLEQALIDRKISYRLFTSNIAMKASKWSNVTTK